MEVLVLVVFVLAGWTAVIVHYSKKSALEKRTALESQRIDLAVNLDVKFLDASVFHGDNGSVHIHQATNSLAIIPDHGQPFISSIDDVEEVAVVEDGVSISTTKRKNTIGRAAVGGVALGGVGAVLGGLTAKSITSQRQVVSKIDVQIMFSHRRISAITLPVYRMVTGSNGDYEVVIDRNREKAEILRAEVSDSLFASYS